MRLLRRRSIVLLTVGAMLAFVRHSNAQSPAETHLKVELISEQATSSPGRPLWVGPLFRLEQGWHIYWQNPGNAGEPPKIQWGLPAGSGNMQRLQREWTSRGVVWLTVVSSAPGKQGYVTASEENAYLKQANAAPTAPFRWIQPARWVTCTTQRRHPTCSSSILKVSDLQRGNCRPADNRRFRCERREELRVACAPRGHIRQTG
jgi:hypothetical protein